MSKRIYGNQDGPKWSKMLIFHYCTYISSLIRCSCPNFGTHGVLKALKNGPNSKKKNLSYTIQTIYEKAVVNCLNI